MPKRRALAAAACALALSACTAGAAGPASTAAPPAAQDARAAASAFLDAFNALDRQRFEAFLADEVTVFFPSGRYPARRVAGRQAVAEVFGQLFEAVRARGGSTLGIAPRDLLVQQHGATAVVTFHLESGENVGRRTLVLRREGRRWLLVHLHASSQPVPR